MQTKCWPRVQSRKTDSLAGSCSRLPFRGQEGLGQMLEERKRKKGEEEIRKKKQNKTGMKSTAWGQGPASPLRFSCVKACPVLGSLPAAAGSVLAACVQMSVCSTARDLGEKPSSPGVGGLCHQNLSVCPLMFWKVLEWGPCTRLQFGADLRLQDPRSGRGRRRGRPSMASRGAVLGEGVAS